MRYAHSLTHIRLCCLGALVVVVTMPFHCRRRLLLHSRILCCVILWHIMACDFGSAELCLYVHDNRFSTMSRSLWFATLFWCERPNILQENRITLHMQSQNVCCFPGRWVDGSIYRNIVCCFCSPLTFKLSGTNVIYIGLRHSTHIAFMCLIARVSGYASFPPARLFVRSFRRLLSLLKCIKWNINSSSLNTSKTRTTKKWVHSISNIFNRRRNEFFVNKNKQRCRMFHAAVYA